MKAMHAVIAPSSSDLQALADAAVPPQRIRQPAAAAIVSLHAQKGDDDVLRPEAIHAMWKGAGGDPPVFVHLPGQYVRQWGLDSQGSRAQGALLRLTHLTKLCKF